MGFHIIPKNHARSNSAEWRGISGKNIQLLYFSESDNRDDLKELRRIIGNPSLLRQLFDKTFDDLTENTYD